MGSLRAARRIGAEPLQHCRVELCRNVGIPGVSQGRGITRMAKNSRRTVFPNSRRMLAVAGDARMG